MTCSCLVLTSCVCLPTCHVCLPARDITRAISGRDLGYLTGAVVGGVIYDRWGRNLSQLMMAVAISMLATITVSEGKQPVVALLVRHALLLVMAPLVRHRGRAYRGGLSVTGRSEHNGHSPCLP